MNKDQEKLDLIIQKAFFILDNPQGTKRQEIEGYLRVIPQWIEQLRKSSSVEESYLLTKERQLGRIINRSSLLNEQTRAIELSARKKAHTDQEIIQALKTKVEELAFRLDEEQEIREFLNELGLSD